jgi:periplasmic protein TonB
MSGKEEKKSVPWGLVVLMIIALGAGIYIVKIAMTDTSPRKKNTVATVTLLKPPPVVIKEKPPEPEPVKETQKKEDIIDPGQKNESPAPPNADNDNTPAGDKLGLDAEGSAGNDAFGLVGKKGGRSVLAGGNGMGAINLMGKYAGYTQIVTTAIRKKVMKCLDEEGGIPSGKLQAVVRISVDNDGAVVGFHIIGSSGNNRMDEAVKRTLGSIKISEPPPNGMPRTMDIRITSQG